MKGYLHVGGAFVLGAVIIAGSLYLRSYTGTAESPGTVSVVNNTLQRQYFETRDTDGDGISDWEEELQKKVIERAAAPIPEIAGEEIADTYTDQFARSFFEDFVRSQNAGVPLQDQENFIEGAVASIEEESKSKIYTKADLSTIESSSENIRLYGNAVANVIVGNAIEESEDEILILQRAIDANDPTILEELAPAKAVYEDSLKETLSIPVPGSLTTEHLILLNAYQAMLDDVSAMEKAFTDPLYTIARVKRYGDDANAFHQSFVKLSETLRRAGITYTEDEPGTLFHLF